MTVVTHPSLSKSLAFLLSNKLANETLLGTQLVHLFMDAYADDAGLLASGVADLHAVMERDPACDTYVQCLLFYKGFQAVQSYRLGHWLWKKGRHTLALAIQSRMAEVFTVDIHPAARLGQGLLFDHATGIVIGETAVVGDNVSMLHHVTLGGSGTGRGRRHPTIGEPGGVGPWEVQGEDDRVAQWWSWSLVGEDPVLQGSASGVLVSAVASAVQGPVTALPLFTIVTVQTTPLLPLSPPPFSPPGNGTLLGAGVSVLGPIIVGANCKIGAGSVVLTDLPPSTVAGVLLSCRSLSGRSCRSKGDQLCLVLFVGTWHSRSSPHPLTTPSTVGVPAKIIKQLDSSVLPRASMEQ